MREAADLEQDMVCTVEALSRTVEFLNRFDRLQAALNPDANRGRRSALIDVAEDGLAAAHRVLDRLKTAGLTDAAARIPAQRRPPVYGHDDPGPVYGHGDPGE